MVWPWPRQSFLLTPKMEVAVLASHSLAMAIPKPSTLPQRLEVAVLTSRKVYYAKIRKMPRWESRPLSALYPIYYLRAFQNPPLILLNLSLLPMVVVSTLRRTNLPDELERMIFLLASRKPHELANYVRVARRVRAW